ncbi:MAG: porin family protein [Bacteroidales bacterium]|jgi:outer membrane protein|nr:porin family protein [Bacteroidales bacterium]
MKKIFITFAVLLTVVFVSNAQLFVGGSLGLSTTGGKEKTGSNSVDKESTFGFEISPKVGYYLSDKFAIGGEVTLGFESEKTPDANGGDDQKDNFFSWGIAPFARYSVAEFGKFSVLLEGGVGIFGGTSKTKLGSQSFDGPSLFGFGVNVTPLLSYSLSDRFNLEMGLNFLNFGFNTWTIKTDGNPDDTKDRTTNFGFGVDTDNVFQADLGAVTIGFIYKF